MSLIIDESTLRAFEKEGVKHDTSYAFAHLFAFIQGNTKLESPFREKFEEIGLVTPENDLLMDDMESNLEWILLTQVYDGLLIRKYDEKDECFKYQNSEQGNVEAVRLIKELSKQ